MPRDGKLLTLYKYRSLAPPFGRAAVTDILLHNRLFWQSPLQFNDPYDSSPVFIFGQTAKDRAAYIKKGVSLGVGRVPRHVRRAKRKELQAESAKAVLERMTRGYFEAIEKAAVTCFSEINDSLLMWSHYADSHKGLCFVFREVLEGSTPFLGVPVKYSEERPVIDLTTVGSADMFIDAVLTKAADWAYEREVRTFEQLTPPGPQYFPAEALTGVIFGARIGDEDRAFVNDLLSQRKLKLQRLQARLHPTLYSMEFEPITA